MWPKKIYLNIIQSPLFVQTIASLSLAFKYNPLKILHFPSGKKTHSVWESSYSRYVFLSIRIIKVCGFAGKIFVRRGGRVPRTCKHSCMDVGND